MAIRISLMSELTNLLSGILLKYSPNRSFKVLLIGTWYSRERVAGFILSHLSFRRGSPSITPNGIFPISRVKHTGTGINDVKRALFRQLGTEENHATLYLHENEFNRIWEPVYNELYNTYSN